VLSSFPIAIIMNAGRIAMIAVLLDRFDIDTSTGSAHAFEGFAVFLLCIVVLFLEVWCLIGIGKTRGRFVVSDLLMFDRGTLQRLTSWPMSRTSLMAGTILLIGGAAVASLPARTEIVPQRQPFALFPMEFNDWRGTPQTLDRDSLNALGLSDYLLADFTLNDAGADGPLNLYVAYYASQRAGIHAHSPQLCIPGGGWNIISQSIIDMPWATGSIYANRVVIEKQGVRQIVYYWFEERGRHIAKEGELKYYALKDALFANRSDGALVRIVAPINDGNEAAADLMARKFVGEAGLLLPSFVSGRIS
jgi:EpsI family protein